MLTSEILTEADHGAWQAFASTHVQCGLYHHLGWRAVIEGAYGHRAPYLLTKTDGRITGILPLVLVRSRVFGTSLTSLPFVDYGGIVADDAASQNALLEGARKLGRELGVEYIELRQLEPVAGDFETSTHKVLMTLDLDREEESAWKKLSSERRNRARRALKAGLSVEAAGAAELPIFYDIWTRNMRDLGSPPHSQLFFEKIIEQFAGHCSILLVRHEGQHIGAALALFWKDTFTVPWVSSLREHFRLYPNNILYWEAMRLAIQRGLGTFDFGRSSVGSGTYEFKQRWGAVATPLHWQFIPVSGNVRPPVSESSKLRLAAEIWKKLPMPITRIIGPSLRKNITA